MKNDVWNTCSYWWLLHIKRDLCLVSHYLFKSRTTLRYPDKTTNKHVITRESFERLWTSARASKIGDQM